MQKIFDAIKAVYDFIIDFPQWLLDLVINIFTSLFLLIKDAIYWLFDMILQLAASLIQAIDLTPLITATASFGSLPAEIINVLALCRVGEALAIIVTALLIRFALQLIPFVRLGS